VRLCTIHGHIHGIEWLCRINGGIHGIPPDFNIHGGIHGIVRLCTIHGHIHGIPLTSKSMDTSTELCGCAESMGASTELCGSAESMEASTELSSCAFVSMTYSGKLPQVAPEYYVIRPPESDGEDPSVMASTDLAQF
jgi:hypothetical protein